MTITTVCPECGAGYKDIQESYPGKRATCKRCKKGFEIRSVVREETGSSLFKRVPKIVYPKLKRSKIFYSPQSCPRLTGWSSGININRKDRSILSYQEIILISILLSVENSKNRFRMLLFIENCKRPFIVESHTIQYPDFPRVSDVTSIASLRNLLLFLVNNNPEIILDENTYNLGLGFQPKRLEKDVDSLSTALVKILESGGHSPKNLRG